MKKIIVSLCVLALGAVAWVYGRPYVHMMKVEKLEKSASEFMLTKFSDFAKTWDNAQAPKLFFEEVDLEGVAKILPEIKETVGACSVKAVSKCESLERYKNERADQYHTNDGYSVVCTFNMACEKMPVMNGESVFVIIGNDPKLYIFSLSEPNKK